MDSSVIRTYLLSYIFDILETPLFRRTAFPCGESEEIRLIAQPAERSLALEKQKGNWQLLMIKDALQLCLSKVFGLLFTEDTLDPSQLYTELAARFGEGILPPVERQKLKDVQHEVFPNFVFACTSEEDNHSTHDEESVPPVKRFVPAPESLKFRMVEMDYAL